MMLGHGWKQVWNPYGSPVCEATSQGIRVGKRETRLRTRKTADKACESARL